jgi:hypothetical protein
MKEYMYNGWAKEFNMYGTSGYGSGTSQGGTYVPSGR